MDQSVIVHIFEILHLKNNLTVDFTRKNLFESINIVMIVRLSKTKQKVQAIASFFETLIHQNFV